MAPEHPEERAVRHNPIRQALIVVGMAFVAVVAVSCSSTSEQVSDQIAEQVQESLELDETPTVTCPDDAEAKEGETFDCTLELEAAEIPLEVVFTSDSEFESTVQGAVYKKAVLLEAIETQISGQDIELTELDCPGKKLVVIGVDEVIDCPATDSDGVDATIKVGLEDGEATITDVVVN